MEKVYLLLRNNLERGPFSYPQLLSQSLVPTDLIWIEGVSNAWMSPADVEEFNKANQKEVCATADSAVIHGALPVKASVLYPSKDSFSKPVNRAPKNILGDRTLRLSEDGDIDLRIHKKGVKLVSLDQLAGTAFIALVLTTAWFGRHEFFAERHKNDSNVSPVAFTSEQSFAAKEEVAHPPMNGPQKIVDSITTTHNYKPVKKIPVALKKNYSDPLATQPAEQTAVPEVKKLDIVEPGSDVEKIQSAPVIIKETKEDVIQNSSDLETDTSLSMGNQGKKKKSFGKAIKGLFTKKNKDGDRNEQ